MLHVDDLAVDLTTYSGVVRAVRGVSFALHHGESVALVGESGSGKSVTAKSILRLLGTAPSRGRIYFEGQNLLTISERELQSIRGAQIGMVFQDPMTALNPTQRIGTQIAEGLRLHKGMGRSEAREEAVRLLRMVDIPDPESRIDSFPHELSGGMRQRVCLAIALACKPKLLIADEPTTALDVVVQKQILERLAALRSETGMALLLITHDLGIVASMCSRVLVMYAGKIVESGPVKQVLESPRHPYTQALLAAIPKRKAPLQSIPGSAPDLIHPPGGCAFHPRCPYAMNICARESPDTLTPACWLHREGNS